MKKVTFLIINIVIALEIFAQTENVGKTFYTLENSRFSRTLMVQNGILSTQQIVNKDAKTILTPIACDEFVLRISQGTDKENTDIVLTAKDFVVTSVNKKSADSSEGYQFHLENKARSLQVDVHYEFSADNFYINKYLILHSDKKVTLEKIDVEAVSFNDAYQNYQLKQITARQKAGWKPGLGQPVYTSQTATFWGMEFPAAFNTVENHQILCGYFCGRDLLPGQSYVTYPSVVGMADDKDFIDDAFFAYIDRIRIRPSRLQVQYNSWFDYRRGVSKKNFIKSVRKVHQELVEKRGCLPLNAYVIDDGWQDTSATTNWSDTVWKVNSKFKPYFSDCRKAVANADSKLGLWLSPASILGARQMVKRMDKYGFESLSYGMSMTGEKYMQKLEDRIIDLAKNGVSYFKFDGLFGDLNRRDFEIYGRGTPVMSQLGLEGFSTGDERLNDSRYDELKSYYLVAGTERLIQIFKRLQQVNPDIYIAITNGAYLSPWWLCYVDIVWLINAGDAMKGKDRTDELVYRDYVYHQIWQQENTKFPMNSIFNHEPKKVQSGESPQSFRDYLFMNLSRGTSFVELYIKTDSLSGTDWDILAEGLKWTHQVFPLFKRVRMHGGNPDKREVYGYSAWTNGKGYISVHNPSSEPQKYEIVLNREMGLYPNDRTKYTISSPLGKIDKKLRATYRYGERLSLTLKPKEVVLLNFD